MQYTKPELIEIKVEIEDVIASSGTGNSIDSGWLPWV